MDPILEFRREYAFLSNFFPVPQWNGKTVEHYFQAAKVSPGTDMGGHQRATSARSIIVDAPTPAQAKQRGRDVELRKDWNAVRVPFMLALLRQKFSVDPLRQKLLKTGDAELIESNTWGDQFWGVYLGKGENQLGKLLMFVRDELRTSGIVTTRVVNANRDAFTVSIMRVTSGGDHGGLFGNHTHGTAVDFTFYFEHRMGRTQYANLMATVPFGDFEYQMQIQTLKGEVLGCGCKPLPCHGDAIAAYLNEGWAGFDRVRDELQRTVGTR